MDSSKVVEDYLKQVDWKVRENANLGYSFSSLFMRLASEAMEEYVLDRVYPPEVSKAHREGDFHLHNLQMGITGYCAGWSIPDVLVKGFAGVPARTESAPAKHFSTALLQLANFIGTLQNEWNGAMAYNSLDTLLAPFVAHDKLSYKEVKQHMQQFIFNLNITSRWGGQCVSEDTEALTLSGWKRYNEIIANDKLATFNMETGEIEYLPPDRIGVYDYDDELICIKNRIQEQLVTPNHRVVRKRFNSEKLELIEAAKLSKFKTPVLLPIAGKVKNKTEVADEFVKLLAWLVAEGSFSDGNRKRVYIYQSEKNKECCDEIRDCLKRLGFGWDERRRIHGFSKIPGIRFRLNQASSKKIRETINSKKIPELIKMLSSRQIRLFVDTYAKGDGYFEHGKTSIYTKDEQIKDKLQELCALCGYGTTNRVNKYNNVWVLTVIKHPTTYITQIYKTKYKGKVWCPTTKNNTFVARRKGKVFITGNSPFTNITFDLKPPEDLRDTPAIIGGKPVDKTYGEFQDEMDFINKAFMEVMTGGDIRGRTFTFPLPTYNITKDFEWDSELSNLLFEMTAKYGVPYFQNFVGSDLNPKDIRAMCCRLRLDLREMYRRVGGFFGYADKTGSVGVVTINLPRIAYESKGDEARFFERLAELMELAKQSLEIKREVVQKNIDAGLLPYTKEYLGTLQWHFSTIGLVGGHEACLNFGIQGGIASKEGKAFAIKTLEFMKKKLLEFQNETGHIYNLEATPAEGATHSLASLDKKKCPGIITAGEKEPYYTNSTHLPVNYTNDVFEALKHQDDLQVLYTGGTVLHTFLGERISGEAAKTLVKKIVSNFRLPYFTLTPTFSICQEHGYVPGEHFKCPTCGKPCEVYSRVVGYYRPVQQWNAGKQEEFRQRLEYKVESV